MEFTKLTCAVACGIIAVPFLICGGCFFIGAAGTSAVVGTSAAISNEVAKAEAKLIDEAIQKDQQRFQREQSKYNETIASIQQAEAVIQEAVKKLEEWKQSNPEPTAPDFPAQPWKALFGDFEVVAKPVNANDTHLKLLRDDGKEVVVPIEKLVAESRIAAKKLAVQFDEHRTKIQARNEEIKKQTQAIAELRSNLEPEPTAPKAVMTRDEAESLPLDQ